MEIIDRTHRRPVLPMLEGTVCGSLHRAIPGSEYPATASFPGRCGRWMPAVAHDRGRWHPAFRRCWPKWRSRVQSLSQTFGLPRGGVERLSLDILVNSQLAVGCLQFLERCRPAAVVTDHDRARLPSCLVLAARSLGIPAFSLQHGVLGRRCRGICAGNSGPDVLLGRTASADHD